MKSKPTVYWDTCLFFALIKDEKRKDAEDMPGLYSVASEIESGAINMVTSSVTLTELNSSGMKKEWQDKFNRFMERSNVDVLPLLPLMGERAGHFRDYYRKQSGKPNLCRDDAYHLATAIVVNVSAFHTFDARDKKGCLGLLGLNGNVAGYPLRIVKPRGEQGALGL